MRCYAVISGFQAYTTTAISFLGHGSEVTSVAWKLHSLASFAALLSLRLFKCLLCDRQCIHTCRLWKIFCTVDPLI